MFAALCACTAADVDDITVTIDVRDDDKPSTYYPPSAASHLISDVSTAHDTVAGVSAQFNESGVEAGVGVVEPDDGCSTHDQQYADSNRAAIDLLLWKLTELERRITLGHVRNTLYTTRNLSSRKTCSPTPEAAAHGHSSTLITSRPCDLDL